MTVRPMRPTERGAVRNLGAPFFEHLGGYRDAFDAWLRNPSVVTVVSGGRGGPVGFALVGRTERDGGAEAYLLAIGVSSTSRRRGMGRELLQGAIHEVARRAGRWGVSELRLDVEEANDAGRALFEAAGFVVVGPGEPYSRGQSSLRMERPIP